MSTSPATGNNDSAPGERRCWPRERFDSVVLVFFGQGNWGKLIDLNENGMSIEFAHTPTLSEPINFTFEANGCAIETEGQVKWIRDFERTAGVRFLDPAEKTRDHLRHWISHTRENHFSLRNEVLSHPAPEIPPSAVPETRVPSDGQEALGSSGDLRNQPMGKSSDLDLMRANFDRDVVHEMPAFVPQTPEPLAFEPDSEPQRDERQVQHGLSESSRRWRRTGSMAALTCLAVLSFAAGITRNAHKPTRAPESAGDGSEGKVSAGQATERVAVRSPHPFVVEVLDTENRRWVLWFADDVRQNTSGRTTYDSPWSMAPRIAKNATSAKDEPAQQNRQMAHHFSLVPPNVRQPERNASAANSASPVAPAVVGQTPARLEMLAGILGTTAPVPAPVERTAPVGGDIQPPRLLQATKPTYPPRARTYRVQGDVILNAVIDPSGNPKDIKVISGPLVLRDAAVEAVRQWKYEPARLDGKPTAMSLTVTLEFHLN